jgi:hypothetical protein
MSGIHLPAVQALWRHGIRPWQIAVETSREAPGVPWRAVTWMRQCQLSGNLVIDYAWAQYAIWHLHPEVRVAFDGRYRTVYRDQLERDYLAFARGELAGEKGSAILESYPTEMALLPVGSPGRTVLDMNAEWVLVFSDHQACVYVRRLPKFQRLLREDLGESVSAIPNAVWMPFPGGPVRDPLHARNSANDRIRQTPFVCNGYHNRAQARGSAGNAGLSDKHRDGKPMRFDGPPEKSRSVPSPNKNLVARYGICVQSLWVST